MAKKSTGAQEVNGFIAVTNDKPKTTKSKPAVTANSSSSKATSRIKDAKPVRATGANPPVKKAVGADKEVKKVESKTKKSVVKTETTLEKAAISRNTEKTSSPSVKSTSSSVKTSSTSKSSPAGSNVKPTPVKGKPLTSIKSSPDEVKSRTTVKSEQSKPTKTAPSTVKREGPPIQTKTSSRAIKTTLKTTPDLKATSKPTAAVNSSSRTTKEVKTISKTTPEVNIRTSVSKPVATKKIVSQASKSNGDKRTGVAGSKKPTPRTSGTTGKPEKTGPLKVKPDAKLKADDVTPLVGTAKVLGKSGISFDITLEPAKVEKPKALPSEVQVAAVATVDGSKSSTVDDNNDLPAPPPPPLVKQRTFVKDEEDEELKSSLPHIVAPDELDISQGPGSSQYEDDDFEEDYESDFEDPSEMEPSISEASVSTAPKSAKREVRSARKSANRDASGKSLPTVDEKPPNKSELISDSTSKLVKAEVQKEAVVVSAETTVLKEANEYDYEDDFEDYSSDFEEDTESGFTSSNETSSDSSTTSESSEAEEVDVSKTGLRGKVVEEERKLDSGNYDLKTTIMRSEVIKQSQLNDIKEAISRENTMFKDGMPIEKSPSPPPIQIMDFKAAFNKIDAEHEKKRKERNVARGKVLLNMIKLHAMSYDLFEMQPMSYEAYMKLKGSSNNTQEETQTKEDDVWEETQTDEIKMDDKWTQWPISYHSWAGKDIDWRVYIEDKRGFGKHSLPVMDSKHFLATNYNAKRLQNFVNTAAQIMTVLLEEETQGFKNALSLQQTDSNLGFSDGYVPIYCDDIDFLKDRRVTHICFSPHFSNIVVTCYDQTVQPEEYLPVEITSRWLICLWDMIAVSKPLKVLVASAPVASIIFDCLYSDLIYAGLADGIICLWDLSEPDQDHDHCRRSNFDSILRTPTYCTYSSGVNTQEIHTSPVVCLRSTSNSDQRYLEEEVITPTTLYSMSEDGKLILWTVVRIPDNSIHQKKIDVRVSPWGRVRLALTSVHHPHDKAPRELRSNLDFLCMEVKQSSTHGVLLGTNMGFVLQYPLVKFKTVTPRFGQTNSSLRITAIELCPHDSRCFLVGVSDGTVRLHSEQTSRPLKVFVTTNMLASGIASIKWSSFKAGLIVTLDQNSNLLVWNLCKSDLQPVVKMSFKAPSGERDSVLTKALSKPSAPPDDIERIAKFILPPNNLRSRLIFDSRMDLSRDIRLPYLGIVISEAAVHVHRFSSEFAAKGADIKNRELDILRTYLDLLHK